MCGCRIRCCCLPLQTYFFAVIAAAAGICLLPLCWLEHNVNSLTRAVIILFYVLLNAETAMIWDTLMWKAWVAATVDSTTSPYFLVMFAFATRKARPRWAAAAMWARATRLRQAQGDGDDVFSSVACAVSALSLVPPSQAYVLGRDWWPACPDPTSMVTIDDMRRELVHLSK
jgi:hypothetical protein